MMILMRLNANLEFTKNKDNYRRYFVVDFIFYTLYCHLIFIRKRDGLYEPGDDLNNSVIQFLLVIYILNIYQVLVGYCILYLKINQDIIRSISRLDNLYIVSQFQIATSVDDAEALSMYSEEETSEQPPSIGGSGK